MEEVITPYIIDNENILLSITPKQLEDIRTAVNALNKRRVTLRNKMASRRESKGTSTKPYKPVLTIAFPQRCYPDNFTPISLSVSAPKQTTNVSPNTPVFPHPIITPNIEVKDPQPHISPNIPVPHVTDLHNGFLNYKYPDHMSIVRQK